ncbi:MAG: hypothetical protein OQK04_15460, partial [Kangiellaceae bacterium]|nr:hypothetical protein [Kangiellaceae bacterium]
RNDFIKNIDAVAYELKLQNDEISWHLTKQEKQISYYTAPHTSWWDRFISCFMGILPIESQL